MQNENFWRISSVGRRIVERAIYSGKRESPNLNHLSLRKKLGTRKNSMTMPNKKVKEATSLKRGHGGFLYFTNDQKFI